MGDDPVAPAAFSAASRLTLGTDRAGRRASSRGASDGDSAGGAACTSSVPLALAPAGDVDGVAVSAAGADRESDG
jgi:hypothetical protein